MVDDWLSGLRGFLGIPDPNQQSQGLLSDPYLNTGAKAATVMGLLADRAAPKLAGVPSSIADAATLPGDTYLGKADMNTDQGLGRALNMVGFLAGGGMPMAEAGSAGLFGGRLAANAEKQTGWFRSPVDKLERFEIPDQNSKFTMPQPDVVNRLGNVLDHPELYEAYPEMKNTRVYLKSDMPGSRATFNPRTGAIELNADLSPAEAHSSLLHEVQHAIQQQEGFSRGSSPSLEASQLRSLQDKVDKAQSVQGNPAVLDRLKGMESTLADVNPYDQYRRAAGEAEARNVQARQNYGILARQAWPPWVTQDVPWTAQLRR